MDRAATGKAPSASVADQWSSALADYAPLPGMPDELHRPGRGAEAALARAARHARRLRAASVDHASRPPSGTSATWACPIACTARRASAAGRSAGLPLLIRGAEWAEIAAGVDAARGNCSSACSPTSMATATLVQDGSAAGRGGRRQQRTFCAAARRDAAGRALAAPLRRRHRPRSRRPLVGARRPHAGAVGRRLRAGEPAGDLARLSRASTAR